MLLMDGADAGFDMRSAESVEAWMALQMAKKR